MRTRSEAVAGFGFIRVADFNVRRLLNAHVTNAANHALAFFIIGFAFAGCADNYRGSLYNANKSKGLSSQPSGTSQSERARVWHLGDTEYADTNADGRIDREIRNVEGHYGTDGYGRFKTDTDFDGFYDDEREQGVYAGELRWSRPIREPVYPITRALIPGELP